MVIIELESDKLAAKKQIIFYICPSRISLIKFGEKRGWSGGVQLEDNQNLCQPCGSGLLPAQAVGAAQARGSWLREEVGLEAAALLAELSLI